MLTYYAGLLTSVSWTGAKFEPAHPACARIARLAQLRRDRRPGIILAGAAPDVEEQS
jgi:hypothetical protein